MSFGLRRSKTMPAIECMTMKQPTTKAVLMSGRSKRDLLVSLHALGVGNMAHKIASSLLERKHSRADWLRGRNDAL
jgi:hypothetical protein